jgi:hypothetical protein
VSTTGFEDRLAINLLKCSCKQRGMSRDCCGGLRVEGLRAPKVGESLSGSGEPNLELAVSGEAMALLSRALAGSSVRPGTGDSDGEHVEKVGDADGEHPP